MAGTLLLGAIVMIACVLFNRISGRLGIPVLLAFILLGMFFGSDGAVKIAFDDYGFAEQICSTALIFIMFYGGFGTKWSEAKPVAAKAVLLSSAGVVLTAGITGLFCYLVLKINILESFLIGSVISSTDAASVFSILRSKKLNMRDGTASLLEVESGSNDPFAYMLTTVVLTIMGGKISGPQIAYTLFAQIVYGGVCGVVIALCAVKILGRFRIAAAGFDSVLVLAIALLAYAVPALVGGNGYLSVYIVGIIVGNSPIDHKRSLVHFFDGINSLMQMLLFFLLGLLSFPSQLIDVAFEGLVIALFLTFIARPVMTFILLTPFGCRLNQQLLVSWSGLRGAASIVFAVMAVISPASTNHDIFHIVLFIVIFSILIQGSLIPFAARKLNMIDDNEDVMKTFSDYAGEVPVQFIEIKIPREHPWCEQMVSDLIFPPDTILVMVLRNGQKIVPNGRTVLLPEDRLILSARQMGEIDGVHLSECTVTSSDKWKGKQIQEISIRRGELIIMVQRQGQIIIPNGQTQLLEGDVLVMNQVR